MTNSLPSKRWPARRNSLEPDALIKSAIGYPKARYTVRKEKLAGPLCQLLVGVTETPQIVQVVGKPAVITEREVIVAQHPL